MTHIKKFETSEEQIEAWKKEHGDIFKVEVDGHEAFLRKPDRKTMKYVAQVGNDPIRANEVLLDNCWLGGNECIKTDDELFYAVSAKLAEIIKVKEAEITKL